MNVCTGEAMVGGEDFVKPSEFSQLEASGEEQMEVGGAATGAAASETSQASGAGGDSLLGAEDAVQESVEPGGGPMLEVAPGLEAPVDVEGDPISEGSSQLEETTAAEEEGSAGALSSGTPSPGSRAETEGAMEGKPEVGALGESAGTGRAEPGGGGEGPREVTAGMEGWLECAGERGKERAPGEALDAAVPAPVLCVGRGGEAGLVAIAVVGGQAGPGAQAEGEAGEPAVAGVSPRHRDLCGEVSLGEKPESELPHTPPIEGYAAAEPRGKGSAGCQGSCQGNQPQPMAPGTGTAGDKDGPQEGTEQAGVRAEGGQPGPCGNTGEREEGGVWGGSQGAPGVAEQREDSPTGGSTAAPRAASVGQRSRDPHGDVVNPDTVVVPLVQPQDGEEPLL
ncbi:PREDICTED: collagen alpha-2(I) chain-like [Calidris pugnax]|uniref:collagen alpha-2(I) chain-like n=1 Tax=Calidris pugnax TaxID=198806 RepID=UPI00071D4AE3|nr:PREDICTED: collagen alpha-2(I) chain-like [Calidris pugnax]